MILKSFAILLLCFWVIAGECRGQEETLLGKRIYPKLSTSPVMSGKQVIGTASEFGGPPRVREVRGEWLKVEIPKKHREGWFHRGNVCSEKQAIAFFTQQIKMSPQDRHGYVMRSYAFVAAGKPNSAYDDLSTLIQLNPSVFSYAERGILSKSLKWHSTAITDFDTAINLRPDVSILYSLRGNVKEDAGDLSGSLSDYATAKKLDPQDWRSAEGIKRIKSKTAATNGAPRLRVVGPNSTDSKPYDSRGYYPSARDPYSTAIDSEAKSSSNSMMTRPDSSAGSLGTNDTTFDTSNSGQRRRWNEGQFSRTAKAVTSENGSQIAISKAKAILVQLEKDRAVSKNAFDGGNDYKFATDWINNLSSAIKEAESGHTGSVQTLEGQMSRFFIVLDIKSGLNGSSRSNYEDHR